MAKPTIQGREIRLQRREDGRLYTQDVKVELPPPPPPSVETGGPYVVATHGDWIEGNLVEIRTDDFRYFGETPGTVWICNDWKWASSSTRIQQNVISWTNDSIVIEATAPIVGNYLLVRDSANQPIRFCNLEGRVIRARKLRIGVNLPWASHFNSYTMYANVAKHGGTPWRNPATGGFGWDHDHRMTAMVNASAGLRVSHFIMHPRTSPPYDSSMNGKYAVRWEGNAQCAYGTGTQPLTAWHNPGTPFFIVNMPPTGNDSRFTLWYQNNTAEVMPDFVRNVTVVKINDFPGATDEEKAIAALASWDAGVANLDERMFNPAWLSVLRDEWAVRGVRIMDMGPGHQQRGGTWDECYTPLESLIWNEHPRLGHSRVPFEVGFALTKALDAEVLWQTLPADADTSFFDGYANLVMTHFASELGAGRKLMLERGNEAWNFGGSWAICAMLMGGRFARNWSPVMCTRDPVTGKYTAPEGSVLNQPFWVVAKDAPSGSSHALRNNTGVATRLSVQNFVDGQFDIVNVSNSKACTDPWVLVMPYQRQDSAFSTWAGKRGVVDAQAHTTREMRARIPAHLHSQIPSLIATQTINPTIDEQLVRWAERHMDVGPVQVVSLAPYYQDRGKQTYFDNNYGEIWRTLDSGRAWIDNENRKILLGETTVSGNYFPEATRLVKLPNRPYSGWNPEFWNYEGGNDTAAGFANSPELKAMTEAAADCPEGGELMRYWLRMQAACPGAEFIFQYTDMRHDIFGIRRKPEMRNPGRDALMIELKGEI